MHGGVGYFRGGLLFAIRKELSFQQVHSGLWLLVSTKRDTEPPPSSLHAVAAAARVGRVPSSVVWSYVVVEMLCRRREGNLLTSKKDHHQQHTGSSELQENSPGTRITLAYNHQEFSLTLYSSLGVEVLNETRTHDIVLFSDNSG